MSAPRAPPRRRSARRSGRRQRRCRGAYGNTSTRISICRRRSGTAPRATRAQSPDRSRARGPRGGTSAGLRPGLRRSARAPARAGSPRRRDIQFFRAPLAQARRGVPRRSECAIPHELRQRRPRRDGMRQGPASRSDRRPVARCRRRYLRSRCRERASRAAGASPGNSPRSRHACRTASLSGRSSLASFRSFPFVHRRCRYGERNARRGPVSGPRRTTWWKRAR